MDNFFEFKKNKTNLKTEVIAGITTFMATMYIIVINPAILSNAGMPFSGVLTATVLASAFTSIMMGIYAKNPIVLAPGMGINAFFAFTVVIGMGVPWETALGAVFWAGIFFLLLSISNVRAKILMAIPKQLRFGIASGIGLFIALIGFKNAGFIVQNDATLISRGPLNEITLTFLAGFFITSILVVKRFKGALILGIIVTTLLCIPIGRLWGEAAAVNHTNAAVVTWQGFVDAPDFSILFKLDLFGSLKLALFPVIFTILFTDMFDTIATFMGVAEAGNLTDESGDPRNMKESLTVDSIGTVISGIFGTSPTTSYIESATGVEEGGRTGLVAVISGLLFLPFMFLSPLLSIVPIIATAPALVLVGVFMMRPILKIHWDKFDDAIPAFLSLVLIPLTYSITQGIVWGFLSWMLIKLFSGKYEDLTPMIFVINIFGILALVLGK
ncbi:MAG: NCS2 family permease [Thermodesulfobacteriota bacterium]|nr:NCS2 family permease [Thermodesulfobacteriota bacterium]